MLAFKLDEKMSKVVYEISVTPNLTGGSNVHERETSI